MLKLIEISLDAIERNKRVKNTIFEESIKEIDTKEEASTLTININIEMGGNSNDDHEQELNQKFNRCLLGLY